MNPIRVLGFLFVATAIYVFVAALFYRRVPAQLIGRTQVGVGLLAAGIVLLAI